MHDIPVEVKEIVGEHLICLGKRMPNLLEAYYLYGSVSLGAYKHGFSDIDFVAVVKTNDIEAHVTMLKELHRDIRNRYRKIDLMGLYTDNRIFKPDHGEIRCLHFGDDAFKGFEIFDPNHIDAYQLKKYGIALKGPEPSELAYSTDMDILLRNMHENLNTYWVKWNKRCKKALSYHFLASLSLKGVEWGVLGITRLYYTFLERDITSKLGAGEYALRHVPVKWHRILSEAMRLRKCTKRSLYFSAFSRRREAIDYIDHMIDECNKLNR